MVESSLMLNCRNHICILDFAALESKPFLLFVSGDNPYRVDARQINLRASLLQKYLCDEQKELQALYALQALMVHMEQPASECPASHLGACSNVEGLNVQRGIK